VIKLGRTVPTYRNILENLVNEWQGFRKALREEDREAFDRLMEKARMHASAASYEARVDPVESIFMSILLEQEKEIGELRKKIEELEKEK
jgi:hypothetical protein